MKNARYCGEQRLQIGPDATHIVIHSQSSPDSLASYETGVSLHLYSEKELQSSVRVFPETVGSLGCAGANEKSEGRRLWQANRANLFC